MFKPVDQNISFPEIEEKVLKYWKDNKIFEKSVESRPANKRWTFLDGPPFITGMPHYGTLLVSIAKDIFPRFWTMRGYRVRRVWGWDVHGLPAENKVENKLGLKSKKEIEEKVGIKKFIEECKKYVSDASAEWEWYVDHVGRWVDFKNAYKTMDLSYMESVMWVFKQMYDKGHIYKGLRVSLYCPHCATPISNFEIAMDASENYKELKDPATTYKYPLKDEQDTYILAWSTTPWNKIVTPALAVNPDLTYVKVIQGKEKYVLAKTTLSILTDEPYEIVEEILGKDLIGKKYIPHYDYYTIEPGRKAFEIIGGEFVTAEEGTGVVTIAAYGEEDLAVMKKENIHIEMHLDEEGNIKEDVPLFGGMYYLKANKYVEEDLEKRGLIYKSIEYNHKVPLCWRCHTRLYYAPQNAWFVDVQNLKPKLKKNNECINWFPSHFKYGRFLKSLEAAPDWCISRSRYWGSPIPVWECECGERFVPSSVTELEGMSGRKITDLHKPGIDEVTITCKKCGKKVNRVKDVLDSWIEAGSASFAERHFPFNKEAKLDDFFPPDFIVEYTGQIRAWFYVLHVIGTALFDSHAFKNVVVHGTMLGTDGRKMSKNYGNYPDPKETIQKYGGDAMRLYFMGSPIMHGEDIALSEETYRNQARDFLLLLWNIYKFFIMYADMDKWTPSVNTTKSNSILDKWLYSLLNKLNKDLTKDLENYDSVEAIAKLKNFVNDFSTWYIRRSRDRVGLSANNQQDKISFYNTVYDVLITFSKLSAPVVPFITEELYRNLTSEESVHLAEWPAYDKTMINERLMQDMIIVREIAEVGHRIRKENKLKVRQPLASMTAVLPYSKKLDSANESQYKTLLEDELNVKQVTIEYKGEAEITVEFDTHITDELRLEGELRDLLREIQAERKKKGIAMDAKISLTVREKFAPYVEQIKKKVLAKEVKYGEFLEIS